MAVLYYILMSCNLYETLKGFIGIPNYLRIFLINRLLGDYIRIIV